MKRLQDQIVDSWEYKGLGIMDTTKQRRMAEDALNTIIKHDGKNEWNLSWWTTVLIVAISTIVSWVLLYVAINPTFE